ncbi:hypothetical protein BDZ91DRAFT_839851 [Kalaharituber pfeilii]|nr:hypothetical protein BDZ91DRAFT_839851 [Kalaharituber pfeilii]
MPADSNNSPYAQAAFTRLPDPGPLHLLRWMQVQVIKRPNGVVATQGRAMSRNRQLANKKADGEEAKSVSRREQVSGSGGMRPKRRKVRKRGTIETQYLANDNWLFFAKLLCRKGFVIGTKSPWKLEPDEGRMATHLADILWKYMPAAVKGVPDIRPTLVKECQIRIHKSDGYGLPTMEFDEATIEGYWRE